AASARGGCELGGGAGSRRLDAAPGEAPETRAGGAPRAPRSSRTRQGPCRRATGALERRRKGPETAQARRYVSRPAAAASRARATANPMAGSRTKKNSRSRSGGPTLFERLGLGEERDRGSETSQRIREILGLLFVGLSLWLVVALASYEANFDKSAIRNWGGQ